MKKLKLSVEELAVETFDVDASPLGRKGTVEARAAAASWAVACDSIEVCFPQSEGFNVAACDPFTMDDACVTRLPVCTATDGGELATTSTGC